MARSRRTRTLTLDWYGSDIERKVAAARPGRDRLRFDASDLMPGAVGSGSFWKDMTDYVAGSQDLDTALQQHRRLLAAVGALGSSTCSHAGQGSGRRIPALFV